jgi:hypothetical protein
MSIKPQDRGDWAVALSRSTWHYTDHKPYKPCPFKKAFVGRGKNCAEKRGILMGLTRFVALPFSVHFAACGAAIAAPLPRVC